MLVLVGIPDHTVGQALGASVKPISVVPYSLTVYHFSWMLVRVSAWITLSPLICRPERWSALLPGAFSKRHSFLEERIWSLIITRSAKICRSFVICPAQ